MRIYICGDGKWSDISKINFALLPYKGRDDITIIHGLESSLDALAKQTAFNLGLKTQVGNLNDADYVIAFHKYIRGSKRTRGIIEEASNNKIPYRIIE